MRAAEILRDLVIASVAVTIAWTTYHCGYSAGKSSVKQGYDFSNVRSAFMGAK